MKNQLSLKKLFVIWLTGLATLTFLASLLTAYFNSYEETRSAALNLSKTKISRLALLTERVLTKDVSLLKETVSEIASNFFVKEVLIVDPDNKVIFASNHTLIGEGLESTPLASHKIKIRKQSFTVPLAEQIDKKIILSSVAFTWPASDSQIRSDKKGWIFITTNMDIMWKNAVKAEIWDRLIAFLIALSIAIATWFIAFRQIAKPLKILTEASHKVSLGDYQHKIPIMPFKEFNVIRDSFVNMVDEVERKLRSLSDSENRFRLLLLKAPVGIVAFDGNMVMRHVNQVFKDLTGLDQELVAGTSIESFSKLIIAIATTSSEDSIRDNFMSKAPQDASEPANESSFLVNLVFDQRTLKVYSVDTGSAAISKVLYFQDITNELALDKMKSQFIATAAHELRTPMTSIRGYAELLTHMGDKLVDKEKMLEAIRAEAEDVVYLLDDLLDIAKIDAGIINKLALAPTLPEPFLAEVCNNFHVMHDPRNVAFNAIGNLPIIVCDQQKIKQAIKACLSNAFKFSTIEDRVSLTVSPSQINNQSAVKIEISDSGMGMNEEQSKRAFERFYRAEVSGNIPGTGLGLSLVKEIIDMHAGEITIDSRKGWGTSVKIYLYVEPPIKTVLHH